MATIRFDALKEAISRTPSPVKKAQKLVSEYFGEKVFDNHKMEKYLSTEAFEHIQEAIEKGHRINRKIADQVAAGMKTWALEMGATHYSHWFHPLTEGTAEKHQAFVERDSKGRLIEQFSGEHLAQQEPDASSFPSGGLRNTFEARGYTAWDPSSPAFVVGNTLSIPTIFISYTGESLDYKTPLLRSLNFLDKAAVALNEYFDKDISKIHATLGWEQEFFLVDEALFNLRPDLLLTDRTLLGNTSSKDQQLDDNFFSSIPVRVEAFIDEFEKEAYKLGIPIKTTHNEIAPNQFEVAPLFEECNLAVDHNLLLMDMMKKIARLHQFRVIFHEKPFKGINGSSKHNNWSLATNSGQNLLSPGHKPKLNLQFLTYLVNTITAIHDHHDLLRASIVSPGNIQRLGGNEAPPSVMSVFIGNQLTDILDELEKRVTNKKMTPMEKTDLKLDIGKIPEILVDNTDSNRTSPIAFTGNRFEFRNVGSSANCASTMIVLNTAVAAQMLKFKRDCDALVNKDVKKDEAIFQTLRKYIMASKNIRFEGNCYSEEWRKEAKKRGLSDIKGFVDAIEAYNLESSTNLFVKNKIFTDKELVARNEVKLDIFVRRIDIESRVLGILALNQIVPAAIEYQTILIENVRGMKDIFPATEYEELTSARRGLIKETSGHISAIKIKVAEMHATKDEINEKTDLKEKARSYEEKILPFLEDIRQHIDKLELIIDNKHWPLPKYRELLFTR